MTNKELKQLYNDLKFPRMIEEKMLLLLRQGKISKWFSGIGQEAIAVGATSALNNKDVVLPMHRNLGVFTTRKVDLNRLMCQLMGKENGFTKSRDRTFHFGTKEHSIVGMISHLAAMLPVGVGYGLSYKLNKKNNIALAFIGDGATSEGDFHEALNLAAVWNLPVIFLIENNGYGLSTPTSQQYKCKDLVDKAIGYGIEGKKIDGNNVLEVYNAIKLAKQNALKGKGPTLIEAITFRMRGHEEASGIKYVPKKLFKEWEAKDPIGLFEKYLLNKKIISKKDISIIEEEIKQKIDLAVQFAIDADYLNSNVENELEDVYKTNENSIVHPSKKTNSLRFVDAISEALSIVMDKDKQVILLGQDIAEYGGVFKVTQGLFEKYPTRVINTPIIESGVLGASMGLALEGFKPVVEMQFADFVSCGFNQIVNNISKNYYRWGEAINITIRMPSGAGIGAGPFHSQSPEAWFFHNPGIKIVYPSNSIDAKGLLLASIEDPNPVMFFEHKALYRSIINDVPDNYYTTPIGVGNVVQEGDDLTIITYGQAVYWAEEVSSNYSAQGINIEIIDLRSLVPWDKLLVENSIKKTNRVLVLHEANLSGGIGGEIASYISEHFFDSLDAPVVRLGSLDTPIPFSQKIEKDIYLPISRIKEKINYLLEY